MEQRHIAEHDIQVGIRMLFYVPKSANRNCREATIPFPLVFRQMFEHSRYQSLQILALLDFLDQSSEVFITLGIGLVLKVLHVVLQPIAFFAGLHCNALCQHDLPR
jgi:hypothetical protein